MRFSLKTALQRRRRASSGDQADQPFSPEQPAEWHDFPAQTGGAGEPAYPVDEYAPTEELPVLGDFTGEADRPLGGTRAPLGDDDASGPDDASGLLVDEDPGFTEVSDEADRDEADRFDGAGGPDDAAEFDEISGFSGFDGYDEISGPDAPAPAGVASGASPSDTTGGPHRWQSRLALAALLPLGFAALAAAGPGQTLPGSSAQPAERSMAVRTAAQENAAQPTPAGVVASALRPIAPYHSAPPPVPGFPPGSAANGSNPPNPAALVGDVVQYAPGPLGIPGIMMNAYKHAADLMAEVQPGCGLPWYLLAGIGKIESGHASGGAADSQGNTVTRILGPVLDGSLAGNAVITDTDGGALDGNSSYDRAVGPMQFMPGTWKHYGADGNNDGVADPNNVYDATFAAGRLLCANGANLSDPANTTGAILTYNHSMAYVKNVQAWAHAYATGAYPTPSELPPIAPDDKAIDAPDGPAPAPTPEKLPDPPAPAPGEDQETLPGTEIPATTVDVPGLPPVQVPTLPKIELPKIELPCVIDCPPPEPAPEPSPEPSPAPAPSPGQPEP